MIELIEAILSLGTNLEDKSKNLKKAAQSIKSIPKTEIIKISGVYETIPFETPDLQDNYLNCCVKIATKLNPFVLLGACLGIEAAMGRKRQFRFASRIIDIDLLIFGTVFLSNDDLILPHPRIKERAFVLAPLNELCANFEFGNVNFADEYKKLDFSGVKLINNFKFFELITSTPKHLKN